MKDGWTSPDSRRSRSVLYPFSTSQSRPAVVGRLPPASFGSSETKRRSPGVALAAAGAGGLVVVAEVSFETSG
jgi:hypothetical protein